MSQSGPQFEGGALPQVGAAAAVRHAALSIVESEAEVTRWLLQQRLLSNIMGGALPPMQSLSYVNRALDVGCGVGAWAQEVARRYPNVRVVGIDKSAYLIEQASALAARLPNVTFLERDMYHLEGEHFSPGSFDLIHMRFMSGDVPFQRFPALIESLGRLCRRGGLFVSCEAELPLTSSSACDQLASLLLHALLETGRAFSQGFALRLGAMNWINYWLHEAGFQVIHSHDFQVPISYGAPAHTFFYQQLWVFMQQIRPFLLQAGVVQEATLEELYVQVQQEAQSKRFEGVWPLHMLVGMKRLRAGRARPARPRRYAKRDGLLTDGPVYRILEWCVAWKEERHRRQLRARKRRYCARLCPQRCATNLSNWCCSICWGQRVGQMRRSTRGMCATAILWARWPPVSSRSRRRSRTSWRWPMAARATARKMAPAINRCSIPSRSIRHRWA